MNFKKLMVMVMLSILTTNMVAAQSNKYVISTEPLSVIAAGTVDDKIVNNAGMTGAAVRLMLDKMCQERAGISLKKLVTEGTKSPITEAHYNTQALNGGLQVYFDRSPSGEAWKWNGRSLIKDECCNMIGNDRQILLDFLANYAKQSSQRSETYKVENPNTDDGDTSESSSDSKDQQKDKKDSIMTPTDYTGLIIFGSVISFLALCLLIGYFFVNWRNRQNEIYNQAHNQVLDSRRADVSEHYREVGMFMNAATQMNTMAAMNGRTVHSVWTEVNSPNNQQNSPQENHS